MRYLSAEMQGGVDSREQRRNPRLLRATLSLTLIVAALLASAPSTAIAADNGARYVSPSGNDSNPGTLNEPWRTVSKGFAAMRAGQTLYIRGGTYTERVKITLAKGTSASPIAVRAYPNERPVVKGLLWLTTPDYWAIDGLNVTWDQATGGNREHMVKFNGGTGWSFTNAEVWGARSYAAILIADTPASYRLSDLYIHDTYPTNDNNQDHLIYVNSYAGGTGGVIERSLFVNSMNGRAIKIGPPSGSTTPVGNVTIRYNTMYDNQGPANIQLSYGASDNRIYRNILQKVKPNYPNIETFNLNGSQNLAADNLGWEADGVLEAVSGLADGGGNIFRDPRFRNAPGGDFFPIDPTAQAYGRYASLGAPTPTPTPSPSSSPTPSPSASASPRPSPSSSPKPSASPSASSGTRIKDITFDQGSLTGPGGADSVSGPVTLATGSATARGGSAAQVNGQGNAYLQEDFASADDLYLSFALRVDALPSSNVRLAMLANAGTTVGNLDLTPQGQLRLRNGSTTIGGASAPLRIGATYRVGLRQRRGGGGNAILEAHLTEGGTPFAAPFSATTSGTWTSPTNRLRIGATTSTALRATFDDIRLDTAAFASAARPQHETIPRAITDVRAVFSRRHEWA